MPKLYKNTRSNAVALKPNKIIQAGQEMSIFQNKVFTAALAMLEFDVYRSKDILEDVNQREKLIDVISKSEYKINAEPLFENFDSMMIAQNSSSAKWVEDRLEDLVKQVLKIRDNKEIKVINIMSSAVYRYGTKTVNVKFSQDIVPILIDMFDDGYTKIRLASIFKFRSIYSMRLYEELQRVKKFPSVVENGHTLTMQELFFMFGIDRDKEYKKYDNFRQRVLLNAKNEMWEKARLRFDFEEIRKGKPVYEIRFYNIVDESEGQPVLQLSLFEESKDEIFQNYSEDIKLDQQAEEFLESVLENADENIVRPRIDKIEVAEVIEEPNKFTAEQLEKLDEYLKDIFSADEIKAKYDFDYIEFYYNKAKELNEKGMVKDFPNFLYDALIKDKQKYNELKQKQMEKQEAKIEQAKIEKANAEKAKELEQKKKEKEAADIKRRIALFESLEDSRKEKYLEEFYAKNAFIKDVMDKESISEFTKISIGERVEKESIQ